jgi:hypothetical protein
MSNAPRQCLRAALMFFVFLSGAASAASPCAAGTEPDMELRVVAAGIAPDADRTTVVRVYDDGCAQVHRPAYRRDAGEFRVDLDKAALAALRTSVDRSALRSFDAKRLGAELAASQKNADGVTQRYIEADADRYEIRWLNAGKRASVAWDGVPAYAEQFPDNSTLQQMLGAVKALQALADRADAGRIEGGTP